MYNNCCNEMKLCPPPRVTKRKFPRSSGCANQTTLGSSSRQLSNQIPSSPQGRIAIQIRSLQLYHVQAGVKQPGCGVDHSPPYSAEVNERVELYLYSPSGSLWPVLKVNFTFTLIKNTERTSVRTAGSV